MQSIAFSVDIDRPVERVFEFTNDPQLTPLWQTGAVEEVLTPDNPVGVGAKIRRTVKRGARTVVSEGVCVEFVPNEKVVWEITAGSPPRGNVITYAPINGGTRYTFSFVPKGWLAVLSWPLRPLLSRALTRV
ncbi:MAG: SRPBCC family protein, partial [Acidimicrobiia bacterium]|nr:SRPBCC family protein [Acidimicrobiia bacterium]